MLSHTRMDDMKNYSCRREELLKLSDGRWSGHQIALAPMKDLMAAT